MGAFSVLLMIAAAGVTYGWQPDDRGGVEYVIQIPPDQVQELERLGELSSLIDPAVQGHVSRIVIRVGDGEPPRVTPPDLGRRAKVPTGSVAANDLSPVPIPEMGNANRELPRARPETSGTSSTTATTLPSRTDVAVNNSGARALKPQNNDPFSLPQLPSSLRDTAAGASQGLRRDVDRAGRDITARAGEEINRATNGLLGGGAAAAADPSTGLVAPPGTRTPSAIRPQPPAFTGGATTGGFAGTRPGGPTTAPTNSRDSSWRDFAAQPPTTVGPTTEPVGPSGLSFNNRPDATTATAGAAAPRAGVPGAAAVGTGLLGAAAARNTTPSTATANTTATRGTTGLTARDTFGRPPGTTGLGAAPTAENPFAAANRNTTPRTSTNTFPQTQFNAPTNTAAQPPATNPLAAGRDTRASTTPGFATGNSQLGATQSSPDARLSAAQIAAGAWSVDVYGNPVDRQGRVIDALRRNPPATNYGVTNSAGGTTFGNPGSFATDSRIGQPGVGTSTSGSDYRGGLYSDPAANLGQPRPTTAGSLATVNAPTTRPFQTQLREPSFDSRIQPTTRSDTRDLGRSSAADLVARDISARTTRENQIDTTRVQRPKPVAAQPFFNGLLLISFVANLYLVFWLRNLHSKYREMVAAKRLANANTAA